ncbi:MAG: hypothetical protein K0R75_1295, partial [Paenibacillaceae bacterium]|nr:hypothetical protein [Paenibacillaceae bacterium]
MNINQLFRTFAKEMRPVSAGQLELKVGQIVRGVVLKPLEGQDALVNIGGTVVRAQLEAPLKQGEATMLQVQPESTQGKIVLKPLQTSVVPIAEESLASLLEGMGMQDRPEIRQLVQQMHQTGIPLSRENIEQLASLLMGTTGADAEEWNQAAVIAFQRKLPLTMEVVGSLRQALQSESLTHRLDHLSGMLSAAVQSAASANQAPAPALLSAQAAIRTVNSLAAALVPNVEPAGQSAEAAPASRAMPTGEGFVAGSQATLGASATGVQLPQASSQTVVPAASPVAAQPAVSTSQQPIASGEPLTSPAASAAPAAPATSSPAAAAPQAAASPVPQAFVPGTPPQTPSAPTTLQAQTAQPPGGTESGAVASVPAPITHPAASATPQPAAAASATLQSTAPGGPPQTPAAPAAVPATAAQPSGSAESGAVASAPARMPNLAASATPQPAAAASTTPQMAAPSASVQQPVATADETLASNSTAGTPVAGASDNSLSEATPAGGIVSRLLHALGLSHENLASRLPAAVDLPTGGSIAAQPLAAGSDDAAISLKHALLQLASADDVPAAIKDSAQQIVQQLNGQQLLLTA